MSELVDRAPWRSRAMNLFLVVAAVAVAFMAIVAVDSIAGLMITSRQAGLIFSPNSQATYHTTEFDYTVSINSLGFRDREFDVARSKRCRLMAVGDSFTFGWGVSLEDTWPKRLETGLAQAGFDVEVANLGFPGGNPIDYANIAGLAVPMLTPDLVIVGVLLGDDLQMARGSRFGTGGRMGAVRQMIDPVARTLFPHLTTVFDAATHQTRVLVKRVWEEQVRNILADLSPAERARYEQMDGTVRQAFEGGNLNPGIITSAIRKPEYFIETFDLERPQAQASIQLMSAQFARIRRSAASVNAAVMVVSVPYGLYVSRQQFDVRQNGYGFTLDPGMLTSSAPDDAIRQAAVAAGVPFSEFTQAFRAMDGAPLFFRMDGHFTGPGHRLFAEQLTPVVAAAVEALPTRCRK